jgi:hypothetical protein
MSPSVWLIAAMPSRLMRIMPPMPRYSGGVISFACFWTLRRSLRNPMLRWDHHGAADAMLRSEVETSLRPLRTG